MYFGVTTLLDASSSDGLKAEDEQKEVIPYADRHLLQCPTITLLYFLFKFSSVCPYYKYGGKFILGKC